MHAHITISPTQYNRSRITKLMMVGTKHVNGMFRVLCYKTDLIWIFIRCRPIRLILVCQTCSHIPTFHCLAILDDQPINVNLCRIYILICRLQSTGLNTFRILGTDFVSEKQVTRFHYIHLKYSLAQHDLQVF